MPTVTKGKIGFKRKEDVEPIEKYFESDGAKLLPYTTTVVYLDRPDHEIVHKSMASNWIKALSMALTALARSTEFNIEIVPDRIRVERR
jgi:hypothetical protein